MNYFEFYELPVAFQVDAALLKKQFYAFSKKYHPDFYVNEDEAKQQEILELSTLNNKAYQVLSDTDKRTAYVLQMHDLLAEGDKYQLAPDFLMEMMEINEALMEMEDDATLDAIKTQISAIESDLETELFNATNAFESDPEADQKEKLLKIRDIYYRKKYLLRIKNTLNTFATR